MKVYEVKMECWHAKEVTTETQYVVGDSLLAVSKHFATEAEELGIDLISIRYVLTIVQTIEENKNEHI